MFRWPSGHDYPNSKPHLTLVRSKERICLSHLQDKSLCLQGLFCNAGPTLEDNCDKFGFDSPLLTIAGVSLIQGWSEKRGVRGSPDVILGILMLPTWFELTGSPPIWNPSHQTRLIFMTWNPVVCKEQWRNTELKHAVKMRATWLGSITNWLLVVCRTETCTCRTTVSRAGSAAEKKRTN